ncbi:MAG: phasin family protein [Magnetococcales bacterium]|nr:phasin family protein [Magnetococcales bacterium]
MNNQVAENITEMTNKMIGTLTTLQNINTEAVKSLTEKQFSIVEGLISSSTKQLEELSTVKSPEEVISAQSKIVGEVGETMLSQIKENIEILNESRAKMEALVSKEVNEFIEKAKNVAP